MIGYKAFEEELVNRYGQRFEIGKEYKIEGPLVFSFNAKGHGHGFNFCANLEDTLRYVDGSKAIIALVEAIGNLKKYDDEYYGYYDMFITDQIKLIKVLTLEEVFEYACNLSEERLVRMIRDYNQFTSEEILFFKVKFHTSRHVLEMIDYYCKDETDVKERKRV